MLASDSNLTLKTKESIAAKENYSLCNALIDDYYPQIGREQRQPIEANILRHLDNLRKAFPDFNQLKNLRIIDVGSGSTAWQGNYGHRYDPWMSRLLHMLEAKPLALDINPQAGERFESRVVDLSNLNALGFLRNKSFDSYYIEAFPTDTFLDVILLKNLSWHMIKRNIIFHLERSLVPEAKVIQGFTKSNEDFVNAVIARRFFSVDDSEL